MFLLICGAAFPAVAGGNRESEDAYRAEPGTRVEVTGRIRRVGSEPFTSLVITDRRGLDWHIQPEWENLIAPYEQQELTVTGVVHKREMILADGTELAPQWELSEVVITSP
jgi:hypothetical protein